MIDFGKTDNSKDFNDLAEKLVTKVLRESFKLTSPQNPDHTYSLENIKVNRPSDSPAEYMKTKIVGGKMTMRVYGDIIEINKRGKKVNTVEKNVLLGAIPYRTGMGTYLLGSDYNTITQARNNPSVYTTISDAGKVQSAFQLAKGRAFRMTFTEKGSLRLRVGDTVTPLIPLLLIMGLEEREIQEILGDRLWGRNSTWNMDSFYEKIGEMFFYGSSDYTMADAEEKDAIIKDYFIENTKLDNDTTLMLTGVDTDHVSADLLRAALKRLVAVYRKEDKGDDRWDLRTSKLMTTPHLFADRLSKQMPSMLSKIQNSLGKKDIRSLATNIITSPLEKTLLTSDLSRLDPQYNLIGAALTGKTVSPVGEGAISSTDLVENRGRQFHPTQVGVYDLTFSPQGMGIGLSLRAAPGLVVDDEGTPNIKLRNLKTKRTASHTLVNAAKFYILMPGEPKQGKVKAMHNYKEVEVPFSKCTHEYAEPMFADSMQLVPFPGNMQGPRGIMAATQFAQAVPLVKREIAKVTSESHGRAADEVIGHEYIERLGLAAPLDGVIESVSAKRVVMMSEGGQKRVIETESVVPLQYNTGIRIEPKPGLKKGDRVKKGDPLFVTNMHDGEGVLAPGVHLKTVWAVDPDGYGVEDGVIISETAAREKLTSEHFYREEIVPNPGESVDYKKVKILYQHKYTPEQLAKIDPETGIVKVGEILDTGDVIACLVTEKAPSEIDAILGKVSRSIRYDLMDTSRIWDRFAKGKVIAVEVSGRKTVVVISTEEPAEVGTKLTGRFGNKGVVSRVLPDDRMPVDKETGEVFDLVMSPASVPSRVNNGQNQEAALGRTGKRYVVKPFETGRSVHKFVEQELVKAGKNPDGKAKVFNPITGKTNELGVGEHYVLKLFSPEKSVSARGLHGVFDTNLQPVKGGKTGSKAVGLMEFYGLLGHNATDLLKEFGTVKSQKNMDFWRNYEMGLTNMPKDTPYTFGKFNAIMTAAGAQIKRSPEGLSLLPVTDETTSKLSEGRKVREGGTYRSSNMEQIKGGLFDPSITGGDRGELWSEYELEDGVPHPMLSDVLRIFLDVGKKEWRTYITMNSGEELKKQLNALDLKKVEERLRAEIKDGKNLSGNTQALRFLINMEKLGKYKPGDFIIKKIPVIPPRFRPLSVLRDGTKVVNDLNYLYQDVISSDKLLRGTGNLPKTRQEARENLVNAVNAFVGLEEPRAKALRDKGVKGALTYITGKTSPKQGFFLSKMMKKQMINTGRARIIPDPTADMDEVGIPDYLAWNMYEQHLRRKLRQMGYQPFQITDMIQNRDIKAAKALEQVMKEEYILVNRAPTLHRFGILSGKPKIVPGNFISIPTAFEMPLNADYDGDEVTLHAPVTARGKADAERMLLSNHPFTGYSHKDLTTFLDAEAIAGIYMKNKNDRNGFLQWWKEHIPEGIEPPLKADKRDIRKAVADIGELHKGERFGKAVGDLNRAGCRWASEYGLTVAPSDIAPLPQVQKVLDTYKRKLDGAGKEEKVKLLGELQDKVIDMVKDPAIKNNLTLMLQSGAKGSPVQVGSMIGSPVVFIDPLTKEAEFVEGNTGTGYNFSDFLKMNARAREEMVKTKLNVAGPGDLYKQMAFNTRQGVITETDCGTSNGLDINPKENDFTSEDLIGRLLAEKVGDYEKDTVITPDNLEDFLGFDSVKVRSPLTCETALGLCAKCYGVDEWGNLPKTGDHINIQAINSYSMQIAQKAMNAKHSGRAMLDDSRQQNLFERTKELMVGSDSGIYVPVSRNTGEVIRVEENEDKSYTIWVDKVKYPVPYPLKPLVKEGDTVDIGDVLAEGASVNTKDIGNTLGLGYARKLFTDALYDEIIVPEGMSSHQRNVELLARELYKFVEVMRDYEGMLPGDVITIQEAMPHIKELSTETAVSDLKPGGRLGENRLDYMALDIISESMIEDFKKGNIRKVRVMVDNTVFKPVAKGITALPLLDGRDWLDTMGFRFLKRNITQALTSSHIQKLDSRTAPITAYVSNIWDT